MNGSGSVRGVRGVRGVCTVTSSAAAVGVVAGVCAPGTGQAVTLDSVKAEVQSLRAQSETATQRYDQATQQMASLQQKVNAIQAEASTIRQQVDKYYGSLGQLAETQYRGSGIDPTLQLMFAQQPDEFLQRAVSLQALGRGESVGLRTVVQQQQQLTQFRAQASQALEQQATMEQQAAAARAEILAEQQHAQSLLGQLTAAQQRSLDYSGVTAEQIASVPQPLGRAALAIDFVESKLGLWYEWGGTGDPSYDCSGLVQAAWQTAGVQLPRVTWDQINVGQPVPAQLSALQPGDLIFYLDGAHVAMYVGNGLVIHAPTTGQQIQYGEWDMMPITAVRRILPLMQAGG
ncbi:C40 family peptidase [Actinospica sp.]|jgi:cell wall-associated NlpC family hydrolase|uniref:C40 family peptidase n=1 Tax=Actinospica sp. TaxID=1872142 RepID=UPI002BDFD471|nr:NlpC/P60 family protein [Actinospica sp.]HWG24637.1 NlpC/P60 family protein [Actinospica sp.]